MYTYIYNVYCILNQKTLQVNNKTYTNNKISSIINCLHNQKYIMRSSHLSYYTSHTEHRAHRTPPTWHTVYS